MGSGVTLLLLSPGIKAGITYKVTLLLIDKSVVNKADVFSILHENRRSGYEFQASRPISTG